VSGFRQIDERTVYDGVVIRVAVGTFETPTGSIVERDIVRHPGAVGVVPVDGDHVILVRQYRAAADRELLEIPAGKRDVPDEAPELTAVRELEEEIGKHPGRMELLAQFYNSVGFSDEYSYVYLGTDLRDVPASAHGEEEQHMTVERVPLDSIAAMIAAGDILDAKTIVGLTLVLQRYRT
jgi:8-oxo-dGTP pyrophosphatase MutT (NUDIX family)